MSHTVLMDESVLEGGEKCDSGDGFPLVSVIVPFFNVGPVAADCLDSLLAQDFPSYEVICIDDGSTDGTGELLDSYAERYEIIRVFHFDNEGVSAARNRGVKLARAELVSFVDGDDFVSPYYLSTLYNASRETVGKLIRGRTRDGRRQYLAGKPWIPFSSDTRVEVFSRTEAKRLFLLNRLPVLANARLANRSLYESTPFKKGALYEDTLWFPDILDQIDELVLVDQEIYAYAMAEGSLSRPTTMTEKNLIDYRATILHIMEAADTWEDELKELVPWRVSSLYAALAGMTVELPDRDAAKPYLREAVSYIRGHYLEVLRIRHRYSLHWKVVVRCALVICSPRLYVCAKRVYMRLAKKL